MSEPTRKPPKRMTAARLRNIAIAYVRRYGGSVERLRGVLTRRAQRSLRFHGEQAREAEVLATIEALVGELVAQGVVDERKEAQAEATRQSLAGRPRRVIAQRLRAKGFSQDLVRGALEALQGGAEQGEGSDPDWVACCRYARRRGLGPFRRPGASERSREQQLQSLMRAGFAYRWAVRVMDAPDRETLDEVLDGGSALKFDPTSDE